MRVLLSCHVYMSIFMLFVRNSLCSSSSLIFRKWRERNEDTLIKSGIYCFSLIRGAQNTLFYLNNLFYIEALALLEEIPVLYWSLPNKSYLVTNSLGIFDFLATFLFTVSLIVIYWSNYDIKVYVVLIIMLNTRSLDWDIVIIGRTIGTVLIDPGQMTLRF